MCHKMQKSPAFQAEDELFQGYFAWFSSIGSHMGQQTNTDALLSHIGSPLFVFAQGHYIARKWRCVDSRQGKI